MLYAKLAYPSIQRRYSVGKTSSRSSTKTRSQAHREGWHQALDVDRDFSEPTKVEPEAHKPELLSEANKKRGKTKRLPGMEDSEIEELEDAAKEYANIRDDRMNLTREESSLKETLLELMKKNKKEIYRHDGVKVKVVHEEETIKVKILKEKD